MRIGAIVLAILSLSLTGSFAQNASVSDLCAMNTQATEVQNRMIAAVNAEMNPVNKQTLQAQLAAQQNADYQRLMSYFGAVNVGGWFEGSRPFSGFTGTLTRLATNVVGGFDFQMKIDCALLMKIGTRSFPLTSSAPATASDVNALRSSLATVNVGDRVVFDGRVFFNSGAMTASPKYYGPTDGLIYASKITAIGKQ